MEEKDISSEHEFHTEMRKNKTSRKHKYLPVPEQGNEVTEKIRQDESNKVPVITNSKSTKPDDIIRDSVEICGDSYSSSQELMPPPVLIVEGSVNCQRRPSLCSSEEGWASDEEQCKTTHNSLYNGHRPLKRKRSSSRSTIILSDDENETPDKTKLDKYLQRTSSKRLKRSDDDMLGSISSRDFSCSTVYLGSSNEELCQGSS